MLFKIKSLKHCPGCKTEKVLSDFGPRRGVAGARSRCRSCEAAYWRQYRKRNLSKCREVGRKTEARRRRDPQTRQAVLEAQRRSYHNGGKDRAKEYLKRLKRDNFFVWKARRSYVWLTAAELKTLWVRQHGRCALTGRALDDTAELDHVVPRSRGGENSFKNARWLCREANQAKRDLLDTEFLGLCREVIAYATWIGREALAEIKRGEAAA